MEQPVIETPLPQPKPEIKPVERIKGKVQERNEKGRDWLARLRGKVEDKPKEVIQEVAGAPVHEAELLTQSAQLTQETKDHQDSQVEVKKREGVYSRDFFPEASQKQIDIELQRLHEIQTKLQELRGKMTANKAVISPIVEQIREIDVALADRRRESQTATKPDGEEYSPISVDYEGIELSMKRSGLQSQIEEYYDSLAKLSIQGYDTDLRCDELIEAESHALTLRAECRKILGLETESLSPNHQQEEQTALSEQIQREQEYINGENVMSHVTGYRGLIDILKNGNLAARSVQARQGKGEVVASFKEKGRSEEHQIVFDKFTARASYALRKDKDGKSRDDPVIFMMRSRDLMTRYQYMDSDGRHFFGKNHNETAGQYDPFSTEATRQNMAILVPSVYREDLAADLSGVAEAQGRSVEELFEARGVVFIDRPDYTVADGIFKGRIFTGCDSSDEIGKEDEKVVEHLTQIGRSHLYNRTLPKIEGRVAPTQNIGEGAGGVEGKLYIFKHKEEDV